MRKKPYTDIGIRRLKCYRCGQPATQQRQICSDNNQYRTICNRCDVALNRLVLRFMKFKDTRKKIENYKKKLEP